MANERDTDRLANDLLGALMGSITKPMAGTGRPQAQPQVDQGSMLNTIKDFLNQSLPGTKEQVKPGAPAAAQQGTAGSQTWGAVQGTEASGWEAIFRRQGQEREAMHERHDREREDMEKRHRDEMEAAMGSAGTGATYNRPVQRPARPWGQSRDAGSGLV